MTTLVALVGMKHRGTEELVAGLPAGEPLVLVREVGNRYDANAVQVWARDQHVGYVKASQNSAIAYRLDRMAMLAQDSTEKPKIEATLGAKREKWPMVEIPS